MSLLSLVFICRENPRRSGILPFPDCPRFCPLKTRNRIYRLGWTETNLENRERFYFSDTSQISAIVGDHSQQIKTEICTVGEVGDFADYQPSKSLGSSLPIIHWCTTYKFQFLAHFPFLTAKFNIGSIWDRLLAIQIRSISANLRRSAKSKIPDRLGFSRHMN